MPTEKQVLEFLTQSNAIEGVYGEQALDDAKRAWDYLMGVETLSKEVILETHRLLMWNQPLQPDEKGFFRRVPVFIGGHEAVNSTLIPELISLWLLDVETSIKVPGKFGKHAQLDHIEYERIHPFVDGNGRTGRMFLNWERLCSKLPILIIHTGNEQLNYYRWFREL